jgi:hypothetical protein
MLSDKIGEPTKCFQHRAGSNHTDERTVNMAKAYLSAARLRELLHYDRDTGVFTRRTDVLGGKGVGTVVAHAGEIAGTIDKQTGRVKISVDGCIYLAHRLAWLYVTGAWPINVIDHWDTNPSNNAWENLRDVTQVVNNQNRRDAARHNKSGGFQGVYRDGSRFRARIQVDGKKVSLGSYDTPEEAHQAFIAAKRLKHEGCTL